MTWLQLSQTSSRSNNIATCLSELFQALMKSMKSSALNTAASLWPVEHPSIVHNDARSQCCTCTRRRRIWPNWWSWGLLCLWCIPWFVLLMFQYHLRPLIDMLIHCASIDETLLARVELFARHIHSYQNGARDGRISDLCPEVLLTWCWSSSASWLRCATV